MSKKKILLVNEASTFNSGIGRYGFNLLTGLRARGFKVAELAFGKFVNSPDDGHIPWPVYYNNVPPNDPRSAQMGSDPDNRFGKWRLDQTCLDFRPDYVLSLTDPWHCAFIGTCPTRKYFRHISMPTADTFPLKPKHQANYTNPDVVLTYSDWAREELNKRWPGLVFGTPRYGCSPIMYFPMKNKDILRKTMGLDPSLKIVGMVTKNQPRKLLAELILMFRAVADKNPKAMLYIHSGYPEQASWDIPNLLNQSGLGTRVLFTYTCNSCGSFYPSIFKGEVAICQKCNQHTAMVKSPAYNISEEKMNIIFNLFDVYIQYSSSEGAGMPVAEAAYCGLPTVVVDTTAMKDYRTTLNSFMIKPKEYYTHSECGFRGFPFNSLTAEVLNNLLGKSTDELRAIGEASKKLAWENYNWDRAVSIWEDAINSVDPKNIWDAPKTALTEIPGSENLDSFHIFSIFQDYLGINDPYSILRTCRQLNNNHAIPWSNEVCTTSKKTLIDHLNNYIRQTNFFEAIRVGETKPQLEDYLDYAKIKGLVNE